MQNIFPYIARVMCSLPQTFAHILVARPKYYQYAEFHVSSLVFPKVRGLPVKKVVRQLHVPGVPHRYFTIVSRMDAFCIQTASWDPFDPNVSPAARQRMSFRIGVCALALHSCAIIDTQSCSARRVPPVCQIWCRCRSTFPETRGSLVKKDFRPWHVPGVPLG